MSVFTDTSDRKLFDDTRAAIDAATLEVDVEALREIRVSMAQYTVHQFLHGGGHVHEAAVLSELAMERMQRSVAIRVATRTNSGFLAEATV